MSKMENNGDCQQGNTHATEGQTGDAHQHPALPQTGIICDNGQPVHSKYLLAAVAYGQQVAFLKGKGLA